MKTKDILVLEEKILEMLPVKQSEIKKKLCIDHRDVSKLVAMMLKENLVKKTKVGGSFLIERLNGESKRRKVKNDSLLSRTGRFSPCTGCVSECDPVCCAAIVKWLLE